MKVRVVWIGKTRSKELSTLIDDFLERLRRFVAIDITEIRDPRAGDDQRQMAAEEERLLAALDSNDRVVVLDVAGQSWSSQQLAQFLGKHLGSDPRRLTFVIGGYGGLSKDLKARAELQVVALATDLHARDDARSRRRAALSCNVHLEEPPLFEVD